MSTLVFYAQFTSSKVGKDSLTVTWDVERITRSDGTRSALVTGGANSVTVGRRGLYGYVLTGADLALYDYIATAITTDITVDQKEVPALWTYYAQGAAVAGDAMILTAAYDAAKTAATQTSVNAIPTTAPDNSSITAIKAKTDNLPADPASNTQVATRLATAGYTAPDNSGIVAIKAKTDNLPISPAATGDVQAGLTAQGYTSARAGYLDTLNGLVAAVWAAASRTLTAFGFTVSATADPDVALIKAKTDNLPANPASQTNLDVAVSTRATAANVWTNPTRTLTVSGSGATAQEVWEYSTRSLTSGGVGGAATPADVEASTAAITALLTTQADLVAAVTSGDIAQYRGDTWVMAITGLGNLTGYASLDFAIKQAKKNADVDALVWVRKTAAGTGDGLQRLNGAAATLADASITVDDGTLGNITVRIEAAATAALGDCATLVYGVQKIESGAPTTLRESGFAILADTVRATT